MAFYMNMCVVGGYLTKNPELVYSKEGKAWAKASIAVNDGPEGSDAQFVPVKAFGKTAELLSEFYEGGDAILVTGVIRQERWETDGEKRSRLTLVINRLNFLPRIAVYEPEEEPAVAKKPAKRKPRK